MLVYREELFLIKGSLGMISDSVGLAGVQRGMNNLQGYANRIAQYGTEDGPSNLGEFAEDFVGLKQSELQVKASAKVLQSEFRTIGSLIDITA